MKTIAHSNIATRFGALIALSVIGAVLSGSIEPALAHKNHGGGKHGQHHPKPPKVTSQPMPLPTPQPPMPKRPDVVRDHRTPKPVVIRDHRAPAPVVVRDHRTPKVITSSGGGVKVTSTATVRDHRAQPVRDQRGKTTTVKVLGQKVVTVTSKGGKRCVSGVCL
jgi:hypothetical protein